MKNSELWNSMKKLNDYIMINDVMQKIDSSFFVEKKNVEINDLKEIDFSVDLIDDIPNSENFSDEKYDRCKEILDFCWEIKISSLNLAKKLQRKYNALTLISCCNSVCKLLDGAEIEEIETDLKQKTDDFLSVML